MLFRAVLYECPVDQGHIKTIKDSMCYIHGQVIRLFGFSIHATYSAIDGIAKVHIKVKGTKIGKFIFFPNILPQVTFINL